MTIDRPMSMSCVRAGSVALALWATTGLSPSAQALAPANDGAEPTEELVIPAPRGCESADAWFQAAKSAARAHEDVMEFGRAAKAWAQAVEAARCPQSPHGNRLILALASEGMSLLFTQNDRRAAMRLNEALELLLRDHPESASFQDSLNERNIAAAFGLREALAAKLGEPTAPTGSRIIRGRVQETRRIRREWADGYSILQRDSAGQAPLCPVVLRKHPKILYPKEEFFGGGVGVAIVRLAIGPDGRASSAKIVAEVPDERGFAQAAMEEVTAYRFSFRQVEGCRRQSQNLLISFRFSKVRAS